MILKYNVFGVKRTRHILPTIHATVNYGYSTSRRLSIHWHVQHRLVFVFANVCTTSTAAFSSVIDDLEY